MIVEPAPATGPSRRRRAAARIALVAPAMLLALVVGAALLGRHDDAGRTPAIVLATAPSTAAPGPSSAATASPGPTIPPEVDGLRVRTVQEVLAERAAGGLDPPTGALAVAGYLGVPTPPTPCDALNTGSGPLGVLGPLCTRSALLGASGWSQVNSEGFSGIGAHLRAEVPTGVELPGGIERTTLEAGGRPIAVVVIGRFTAPPAEGCTAFAVDCDLGFEIEDVPWFDLAASSWRPEA
jgi:hypothetical protein